MMSRAKYCAVCGCTLSLPDIRNPENPDPDEDWGLSLGDPYDSSVLPESLTLWLTNFRVVGCWTDIPSFLINVSSTPDFFVSPPAVWEFGIAPFEPSIPNDEGKTTYVAVYEAMDENEGMLFPIHQACLDLINQMCRSRQESDEPSKVVRPRTLGEFCKGLRRQRELNFEDRKTNNRGHYFAMDGGIEWSHDYYGARQFWIEDWESKIGWEFLCADPSNMKIPDLLHYVKAKLLVSMESGPSKNHQNLSLTRIPWLFPQEVDAEVGAADTECMSEQSLQTLLEQSEFLGANEGSLDEKLKGLNDVPLGLKNRWRIWSILNQIIIGTD